MATKPSLVRFMGRKSQGNDWLGPVIEEYYRKRGRARWDKPKLKISPSGAYSLCPREIQIRMLGYKPAIDPQTQRRMDNGTKMHERWEQEFTDMGLRAMAEVRMESADISGQPDIILARGEHEEGVDLATITNDLFLLELKSCGSNSWRKLPEPTSFAPTNMANLVKLGGYFAGYVLQWQMYDQLLLEKGLDIGQGYIFLENKDNQNYVYFWVVRDEPLREKLAVNARTALKWNREGNLIGMPFPKTSPVCRECECRDVCFREHDGDKGIRAEIATRLTQVKRVKR